MFWENAILCIQRWRKDIGFFFGSDWLLCIGCMIAWYRTEGERDNREHQSTFIKIPF